MKKITSIILAFLLAAASAVMLFGCGDDAKKTDTTTAVEESYDTDTEAESDAETTAPAEEPAPVLNPVVAAYIEANKAGIIAAIEPKVTSSSGLTCVSDIEAVGSGFVMNTRINELSYVDPATKKTLQDSYNALRNVFEAYLKEQQVVVPEFAFAKINVCDRNGDVLATILAGEVK